MQARHYRLVLGAALACGLTSLASCVPSPPRAPAPAPTPAPAPRPAPAPLATSAPVQVYNSWRDVPQTPGDWSYGPIEDGSAARFGQAGAQPTFALVCRRSARSVELMRQGSGAGSLQMTVRTSNGDRVVTAAGSPQNVTARLSAGDSLLDAIAYSRGRFSVEVPGLETLYLPSWPEVLRVIDDCR